MAKQAPGKRVTAQRPNKTGAGNKNPRSSKQEAVEASSAQNQAGVVLSIAEQRKLKRKNVDANSYSQTVNDCTPRSGKLIKSDPVPSEILASSSNKIGIFSGKNDPEGKNHTDDENKSLAGEGDQPSGLTGDSDEHQSPDGVGSNQHIVASKKYQSETQKEKDEKNLVPKVVLDCDKELLKLAVKAKVFSRWKFIPDNSKLDIDENKPIQNSVAWKLANMIGKNLTHEMLLDWWGRYKLKVEPCLRELRNAKVIELKKAFESK